MGGRPVRLTKGFFEYVRKDISPDHGDEGKRMRENDDEDPAMRRIRVMVETGQFDKIDLMIKLYDGYIASRGVWWAIWRILIIFGALITFWVSVHDYVRGLLLKMLGSP